MIEKSRAQILESFRGRKKLIGAIDEKIGADFRIVSGTKTAAGILSYGDANKAVIELGKKVLPEAEKIPILAGVCGTDPFRAMENFLSQLKAAGFNGVANFPTVGVIDGKFRAALEESGLGYVQEVEMIRAARRLELVTCAFVFDAKQALDMARAGADILVARNFDASAVSREILVAEI